MKKLNAIKMPDVIKTIEKMAASEGITPGYFCHVYFSNPKLYKRLVKGGTMDVRTYNRIAEKSNGA